MLSKLWTEEKRNQSSFEEVKNLAKTLNVDLKFSVINLKKTNTHAKIFNHLIPWDFNGKIFSKQF